MKMERYLTKGIKTQVPIHMQLLLWALQTGIRKKHKEVDYLQVYELNRIRGDRESNQSIIHKSEVPQYKIKYKLMVENPIQAKIYIIEDCYEDKIVETMLLAEEY